MDKKRLRNLLGRFVTGVTVIGVDSGTGVQAGMTANAFTSVSLDPPLLLICVRNESSILPLLRLRRQFSVNILGTHQLPISNYYGGAKKGKPPVWSTLDGIPILPGSLASFGCSVWAEYPGGDHIIVIGKIENVRSETHPSPALMYAKGKYTDMNLTWVEPPKG